MDLKKLNSDLLPLKYPSTFNPWTNPEFSGRILFVGGIHKECTQDDLYSYLQKFGEIIWLRIEIDYVTGLGRGHAFVILATKEGQEKVLSYRKHRMRDLFIGISVWKSSKDYLNEKDITMKRKIFVKRLSSTCVEADLVSYFSSFGSVEKAEIRRNHADNTSRKIAFVIFETQKSADECLNCKLHFLAGREILVKKCRNPTEVKKERSFLAEGADSEKPHSLTYSEESSLHSHTDWSFFTPPPQSAINLLNTSLSYRESDEQPSFNVSNTSFFFNNISKLTPYSFNETWAKRIVPIDEEDETAESNFSSNLGMMAAIPMFQPSDKEDSMDFFFIEPPYKVEATVAFFVFPGYV